MTRMYELVLELCIDYLIGMHMQYNMHLYIHRVMVEIYQYHIEIKTLILHSTSAHHSALMEPPNVHNSTFAETAL